MNTTVESTIASVEAVRQTKKRVIVQSEAHAEQVAEAKGMPNPTPAPPERHKNGLLHIHIEEIRDDWHFWWND